MKNLLILLIACLRASELNAQSVERSVISSSGGEGMNGSVLLTWTSGEAVASSYQTSPVSLYQGFQLLYHSTIVSVKQERGSSFSVSPVPCDDHILIDGSFSDLNNPGYMLYNSFGQVVSSGGILEFPNHVETSGLLPGPYFLAITENGSITRTFKIIKK